MNYLEKIEALVKQQNGTVLSSDLDKCGIPSKYLQRSIDEEKLERTDRGIYSATVPSDYKAVLNLTDRFKMLI